MKAILAIIFAIPFLTWGSGKAIAFLLSKSALKGSPGTSASMGSKIGYIERSPEQSSKTDETHRQRLCFAPLLLRSAPSSNSADLLYSLSFPN